MVGGEPECQGTLLIINIRVLQGWFLLLVSPLDLFLNVI